jgi:Signal transduction histidine kinase
VSSVTGMLALLAVYVLGARIARARPSLGPTIFIAGTVFGGGLAAVVAWWFSGGRNLSSNLPLMTTSIVWLASITLVVSVVEGAVRQSESVIRRLREGIDAREVELHNQERLRAQLAQEVATVLHGVVQGRLAVAQRSPDDSSALARAALDEGIELLASTSVATSVRASDLAADISAPWSALMSIHVEADEGTIPADRVRDVGDVLEECLSNAFRHGGASRMALELRQQGQGWLVVASDDGSGLNEATRAGLGTSLFDAISGGDWSRTEIPGGGCRVSVQIPTN